MLDELVSKCKDKDISEIIGYYFKSAKNGMVSDLYERFGFDLSEESGPDSVWTLDVSTYENKNKLIRIEND